MRLLVKFCSGFLLFFLISFSAKSQLKNQRIIEASYESGPLVSNGKEWADEVKDLVSYRGIDVRFGWRKVSSDYYAQLYRYPTYGLGFTMAIPYYSEIGRPQSIYAFGEFPFSRKRMERKFNFSYFGQIGLGFNLNPYDSLDNPLNQYIGSEVNAYVQLGLKANYQISKRIDLFSTLGLKHYSNGSTRKPNAGINLIPLSLGMRYRLEPATLPKESEQAALPPRLSKNFLDISFSGGIKNYVIEEPSYFRGGMGLTYLRDGGVKYRYGVGLDVFYAGGLDRRFPDEVFELRDKFSLAVIAAWEWKLNERLYVPIAFGAYIHRNEINQESTWFYERIGIRYRFFDQLFGGFQIKAHKVKADFFEFTVGYRFSELHN
ncbi:Lipid A 3-O-deacylase (PagL) [Algoriphagus faecimaris]|uniref:Lipid A 3-O-deacylase (PagL) n=1 Tax=Algoriphagus faecimaris TaxID=686796 RepID=A0A1G6VBW3_9BACT|nr:acyloxyacyl hydrolase [Algoriphagus faecimaris]SDD51092.1 Lipid A 3-O-deacylase (PagL) [Algoriphagus faecimaris]